MPRTYLIVVLAAAVIPLLAGAATPNIVFILADDLAWSDVGYNGADFYETPNVDRLARQGMIFNNAYTGGPNCAPTRACLISGTYTPRHRIFTPGGLAKGDPRKMKLQVPAREADFKRAKVAPWKPEFESKIVMDPSFISVAEVLKKAGYVSARYGKWHLGPDTQGFDVSSLGAIDNGKSSYYNDPEVADRLTEASIRFMTENKDRPFFLYLPHWDVHTPLVAQKEIVAKYEAKLKRVKPERDYKPVYAAMIEAVDRSVGNVMKALDDLGLAENTLVIFSADNGGVGNVTYNAPLRAGKGSLYEGGVRVATCMRWPRVVKAGSQCDTPITSVDLLPTLVELAGGKLPASQPVDGKSFAPLLRGEKALAERAIYWHYPLYLAGNNRTNFVPYRGGERLKGAGWRVTPSGAVREGDWKLVEFFEDGNYELYNIRQDSSETNDLAKKMPEKAKELLRKLHAWQKAVNAPVPKTPNSAWDGS